jgi:hypothetical protein
VGHVVVGVSRHDEDRDPFEHGCLLEDFEERRSIHLRHPEVQHDQIRHHDTGQVERLAAGAGGDDAIPRMRQHHGPDLPDGVIIVRDENPLGHATNPDRICQRGAARPHPLHPAEDGGDQRGDDDEGTQPDDNCAAIVRMHAASLLGRESSKRRATS